MSKREVEVLVTDVVMFCDECGKEITMVEQSMGVFNKIKGIDLHMSCVKRILKEHFDAKALQAPQEGAENE